MSVTDLTIRKTIPACSLDVTLSYFHNFYETPLSNYHYEMCEKMAFLEDLLSFIFLHLMHIPVVILIIITLFGKENEDSKWFVFHTAVLNLILGIIWESLYFCPTYESSFIFSSLVFFIMNLAVNSIFLLAFNRFFYLYFQDFYKKIFNRKTLFFIFLGYDVMMLFLFYLNSLYGGHMIMLSIDLILLCGNVICSTFVFLKIRNMMKLVDNSSQLSTFSDLRKAAFVCIFQTCLISLHLSTTFFVSLFQISLRFDIGFFNSFFSLYMFLAPVQLPMYQLIAIIDTLITLIVLRSYRTALIKIYGRLLEFLKEIGYYLFKRKCTKTRVIHIAQQNHIKEKS